MKLSIFAALLATMALSPAQDLLTNGNLEADPIASGWISGNTAANPATSITQFGGLAPGSTKAAALAATTGRLGQLLPGAGANWQLDFYFAVRNTTNRAFSLFVCTTRNTESATINLRYQSGQFNTFGGGTFGSDLGLGTVAFSTDANADGDLDDADDVKNVYRMRLTGNGWGTGNGTYDIQLSNANQTTFSRSVTGLKRYQNSSGDAAVPSTILFNSLFGPNPGFWVDDVTFENILLPDDPNLSVSTPLPIFGTLPLNSGATTRTVTVQNTGSASNLTISGATVTGAQAALFTVPTVFPLVIPPGTSADVTVNLDPAGTRGSLAATLNLLSNDTSSPSIPVAIPAQLYATGDTLLTNGSFEATPLTTGWATSGTVTSTAGLKAGSTVSATLAGPGTGGVNSTLGQAVIGIQDWQLEFDVLIPPVTGRALQLLIHNFGEAARLDSAPVMIRYENDSFAVFSAATWVEKPALGQILTSLDANTDGDYDDAGDVKNVHRLRVIGRGWGTPAATYDIAVTEANATVFARSVSGLTENQSGLGNMRTSPPSAFLFSTTVGNNPGLTVDNVTMTAGAPPPLPTYVPLDIQATAGGVSLTWTTEPNATYKVWTSGNLVDWSALDGGLPGPSYSDTFAPGVLRKFFRVEKE
jgi:hypothetical protein